MPDRTCQRPGCGKPIPSRKRRDARWCSRSCENKARRAATMLGIPLADFAMSGELLPEEATLTEQYERGREHRAAQDPGEDLREFSDFGMIPGDGDEQTTRFNQMIEADAARRVPRRPWAALRRMYAANPGIELPDITSERVERYRAEQAAIKARHKANPGQPQDRHNPVTRATVATRATESRRLNKHYSTSDPRPPAQRQAYSWDEAEQATWDAYRGGRARGQQSRHADVAWSMRDGW